MSTKDVFYVLPKEMQMKLQSITIIDKLQEIRIKVNKPLIVYLENKEIILDYIIKKEDIKTILQRISNYSIYAFEEEIKQGYITIKGGHRVGICGSCVIQNETVKTIKNIASLNIRICREVLGCSNKVMPYILQGENVLNTIIISPPKCGKTTLIRDITRNLSTAKKKVCIIDERSEIASCFEGVPQMDVGIRTDILDNCIKSQGIIMAIRSMAPEVIVCDEIGTHSDIQSIVMAMNSGVNLITTIHGFGIEDLYRRPVFNEVVENKIFNRAIILSSRNGIGTVEYIYDFNKNEELWRK
ncbi:MULTISPECIES: stage III sporulation protein AA [Clostridium]|uniref:Stage III sporulation protein AA, SpoIIIAA n=1 Tax=Clostridium novyi (strain NT) TaxID=386415 RepID=A0Q090_CLONN|nr:MULTISPECIES: stage III sporulation protein AA [Clostridium]ABK61524.1 stage III sporulation protein AA, SpoIIIAA [Clostridium novyi NT]KEH85916.1 stage III sporulation protein AA [Clostridium novyi A str. NCTC 538]KEH88549.1 stage III sporulation protein AA [Clostridium novyi A str. BKT29909]KEH89008.1 stage III sporulation protein AA [Clostridium novyi A str. 4540]KEH92806.1 stage III sporulation protein AA [Clostridium botulinum C/D str. It1]